MFKLILSFISPIVSALARKYGKRPQFVFAGVMGIIGTAVCISANTDYDKLMAGRLLQGFGTTAFESLSVAVIGDLYFVHERPVRTGAITLTLTCVSSLVSIIGGPITANLGWRYMFIIHLPFVVVGAIGIFFFLPETQFNRGAATQEVGRSPTLVDEFSVGSKVGQAEKVEDVGNTNTKVQPAESDAESPSLVMRKKTYREELALYNGVYTDENIVKLLFTPLAVLLNPAVIWVSGWNPWYLSSNMRSTDPC
jgi:MFS family permease